MKTWSCPSCGAINHFYELKCKCGVEQKRPAPEPGKMTTINLGNDSKVIIKTYKGPYEKTQELFQSDAASMAAKGYFPVSQNYVPGTYGCGSFLLALLLCLVVVGIIVFIYMLIVKPAGTLTVTFEYRESYTDSKPCPRCAETIKAQATACRFCGYEFLL